MTTISERLTNLNSEIGLVTIRDQYNSFASPETVLEQG